MTPIEALAVLIVATFLVCGCVIGFEQLRALQRQAEWDDHCDDALLAATCTDVDCHMCPDMPISIDDLFITQLLAPRLMDGDL